MTDPHQQQVLQLFVRHQARIKGFIVSLMADFAAADDVVQETFLVVQRRAGEFDATSNFIAWAFQIARFQVMKAQAQQQRAADRFSDEVLEALAASAPTEVRDDKKLTALPGCLTKLAPQADYADLFQAMMRDWRVQWKCGEFPFIFVQIERNNEYKTLKEAPPVAGDDDWAEIREAQAKSLATPNTYMVPVFDQGDDGKNRHPLDKKTPGLRMTNIVLKHVYEMQDLMADAPRFLKAEPKAGGMEITFSNVAGGLKVRGEKKVLGFAVGDAERKWMWTEAEITAPDKVFVKFPAEMPQAVAVRYNWAQYCMGNLYSGAELPAEPFRTDSWPYSTAGRR